jgi:hypothetical protein
VSLKPNYKGGAILLTRVGAILSIAINATLYYRIILHARYSKIRNWL